MEINSISKADEMNFIGEMFAKGINPQLWIAAKRFTGTLRDSNLTTDEKKEKLSQQLVPLFVDVLAELGDFTKIYLNILTQTAIMYVGAASPTTP